MSAQSPDPVLAALHQLREASEKQRPQAGRELRVHGEEAETRGHLEEKGPERGVQAGGGVPRLGGGDGNDKGALLLGGFALVLVGKGGGGKGGGVEDVAVGEEIAEEPVEEGR
eukprot:1178370-Prorocentrum_minimum.AAC.10